MAEIVLSQVGAAVGAAALPSGLTVFGQTIAGATLGRAIGSIAGRALDASLLPANEGPRIDSLRVMESREGAGLPTVYGRMRVGGQVIWASRFKEKRHERSAGKGGPKYTEYSYSVSFAVALCQGPVTRVDKIWANGELVTLSDINWRLYRGEEDQAPDPLIEAIEGTGDAPAYRGTAYIVFEDLPLDAFGNRLPQLSFEVVRAGAEKSDGLRSLAKGVNIIPASGEFVYGTRVVRERKFPGIERPLNMNNHEGRADFDLSIDQLRADLPSAKSAALTVAWFGDSLDAGTCRIRPGVETRERDTVPYGWTVDGIGRQSAHLISQTGGGANYGGTPADTCVLEGITALQSASIAVTLSPFLLMDTPGFPWRGRISVAADGVAMSRADIEAFVGVDGGLGFRHFILHHARPAAQAGGVEAFIIGSEMVGLTRVRDENGAFPFVEALIELADEVRAIVGPVTKVSYAADWTEYGAYVPGDGSGDVLFPLDPFWASDNVDFVGIDWYPPVGDWRQGDTHLDADAGFQAADDIEYLQANMSGGEGYDWFYASQVARDAQVRSPILDTAHGENWIFRPKDLAGWWGATHHARLSGIRSVNASDWLPGMKPIRLNEIGFPAVDKGGNAPNLFFDPKSTESALPPYSTGARDDLFQRRALSVALQHWQAQPFMEKALIWAWDGRPWPHYPAREDVWSDGSNWQFGHWLNGRTGLIELGEVIWDIADRAGVSVNVNEIAGFLEGYAIQGVTSLRSALSSLELAYGLVCLERDGDISFHHDNASDVMDIDKLRLRENGAQWVHTLLDKSPGRLQLTYISGSGTYQPSIVEVRQDDGDPNLAMQLSMPIVMGEGRARSVADLVLKQTAKAQSGVLIAGPDALALEPADQIDGGGQGVWRVSELADTGLERRLKLEAVGTNAKVVRALLDVPHSDTVAFAADPYVALIDGPYLPGYEGRGPLIAASADPWLRSQSVRVGPDAASMQVRAVIDAPASIGKLHSPLKSGPLGRWDEASVLDIEMYGADLASASQTAVLNGANLLLVSHTEGWELLSYKDALLIGESRWQLSGLLRGLNGTVPASSSADAEVVLVNDQIVEVPMQDAELGLPLKWRVGSAEVQTFAYEQVAGTPWRVAHLRATVSASELQASWTKRGANISESWTLPETDNAGRFQVESYLNDQRLVSQVVELAHANLALGCDHIRVAEIGADGRVGKWASISVPLA